MEIVSPDIEASPSSQGVNGHGEGVFYGTEPFSKRPAAFYYRFAGKPIPRDRITYVTSESGYFSRQRGERTQLILAFDDNVQAFRVLAKCDANSGKFKETLQSLQSLGSPSAAIAYVQEQAYKRKLESEKMRELFQSGANLF